MENHPLFPLLPRFALERHATSAVEFALLSPIFLLLFFGMTAYGIYLGASHSVQQIAADAARTAVAGLDRTERVSLATGYVARNGGGYAFVDPQRVAVAAGDSANDPAQFVITVSYDARDLPIWNLFSGLPLPAMTIERRSTIRWGGQ